MEDERATHTIFKRDPDEWIQYVYKQVTVLSEDGLEHTGWVYTIDPVSETVVLVRFDKDKNPKLDMIKGTSVVKMIVINNNTELYKAELDQLFRPMALLVLTPEDKKRRQLLLRSWLEKNRMPVTQDGDLITVAGILFIEPPYGPENCRSMNEIVLGRIQGLIKNMPKDHDTW